MGFETSEELAGAPPLPVALGALTSLSDSIDVAKMTKSAPVAVYAGVIAATIEANAVVQDGRGYNSILLDCNLSAYNATSANVYFDIYGHAGIAYPATGVFGPVVTNSGAATVLARFTATGAAKRIIPFQFCLPDSFKIVVSCSGTWTADTIYSVSYQLFNA